MDSPGDVTILLKAWGSGDEAARDLLAASLFKELRTIARRYMRDERQGHTLQATALVNEAYLRMVDVRNVDWQNRAQFFAIAGNIMRRVLVDSARARKARKRGGDAVRVNFDEMLGAGAAMEDPVLEIDAALEELAKIAPRQAQVVELRYFAGLNTEEIAVVLEISARTVDRDWAFARSLLSRELVRKPVVQQ